VKVTLIEATDRLLGAFDKRMSSYAQTALLARGADVRCGAAVTRITDKFVEFKLKDANGGNGGSGGGGGGSVVTQVPYGVLVWAGGIAVRPFVKSLASQVRPYLGPI